MKTVSALNHIERLTKHPTLFFNYVRSLASQKGMNFTIDESDAGEKTAKHPRTNYRLQSILQAPDITYDGREELRARKKMGKTTTEDQFKVERFFWQSCPEGTR